MEMEWRLNGDEMEMEWRPNGDEMETKWRWNGEGMERDWKMREVFLTDYSLTLAASSGQVCTIIAIRAMLLGLRN